MTMKFTGFKKHIGLALIVLTFFTCSGLWWGYAHLTSLVQARLKLLVGPDISVGNVTARWNRIELDQVRIARRGVGPFADRLSCGRIVIRPRLLSLFSGRDSIHPSPSRSSMGLPGSSARRIIRRSPTPRLRR